MLAVAQKKAALSLMAAVLDRHVHAHNPLKGLHA
jgi:hypothetical protein